MPNFDGGHYFLTVLAPVRTDVAEQEDPSSRSHVQLLRQTLARLPTAHQTRKSATSGKDSPFSRNKRTHLARFAVLDDVAYNGRDAAYVPFSSIFPSSNIKFQHIDHLNCSYLLFAADFDASSADEAELDTYLDKLWQTMEKELRDIFHHCFGFEKVTTSGSFIHYIKRCQIETTMPFNDYWRRAPQLEDLQLGSMRPWIAVAAAGAAIGLVAPWIIDYFAGSIDFWTLISSVVLFFILGLAPVGLKLFLMYSAVMREGNKPFPTAPDSDLKSILKALYLQQQFTAFAIDNQGVSDATLQKNFGKFLDTCKPGDLDDPTQPPGVISYNYGETS